MTGGGDEIELKYAVDDAAALCRVKTHLLERCRGVDRGAARQLNHFFDSADRRLRHAGVTLRLRDEDGRFFLTAKGPTAKEPRRKVAALAARAETEGEISTEQAALLRADPARVLPTIARLGPGGEALARAAKRALGEARLLHVGGFENRRERVDFSILVENQDLTLTAELDTSRFPRGVQAHEVEIELLGAHLAAPVDVAMRALFSDAKASIRPGTGKARRFFALLDGGGDVPAGA